MTEKQAPYQTNRRDWGRILLVTRLEKMVDAQFVQTWSYIITKGLRQTDGFIVVKDRVAHQAANDAIRVFLQTDFDTLCFIDSDFDAGPGYIEELRSLPDGWDYDIFQGFYTRRGWPPEAIWFKENNLGDIVQALVWKDDHTEDTAMVGFHNALIRREVFERIRESRPDVSMNDFTWAYYPKDNWQSEDGVFCKDASDLGFRIGSTTKVKCGHISRVTVGWETYQEHLEMSGAFDMWREFFENCRLVAEFTGEDPDTVAAKANRGHQLTKEAWERMGPKTPEEIRAFYGDKDNGYLYDLLQWNSTPGYKRIVAPLREVTGKRVMIIGAGIGGEVEAVKDRNTVTAFELPGVLSEFLHYRYDDELEINLTGSYSVPKKQDYIVAIDVIEHIAPDELTNTLDAMLLELAQDGTFYFHNNFGGQEAAPQHFDHSIAFAEWLEDNDIEQISEYEYRRIKS